MDDLVTRLRDEDTAWPHTARREAADELEALRAELAAAKEDAALWKHSESVASDHHDSLLTDNERLRAELARVRALGDVLEAITAMQALRYGDSTGTHLALTGLCVTARAALAAWKEPQT